MAAAPKPYRQVSTGPLQGGMNDSVVETLLGSGASALDPTPPQPFRMVDVQNVEFNRSSARTSQGALKLNNQTAPRPGVRTKVDPAMSPLFAIDKPLAGTATMTVAVPLRGYVYGGTYSEDLDIGGRYDAEGNFLTGPQTFHNRRGRKFCIEHSFELPAETKLYSAPTLGAGAPAAPTAGQTPVDGFDEALDECVCVLQKGGDRLSPMSWALAVVNVGNGAALSNAPSLRPSNYCLALIWLDSSEFGSTGGSTMMYNLSTAHLPTDTGNGGQFSTQAYRAIYFNKFVVPGRRYNIGLNLNLDTGSPGAVASNTAWNHDGYVELWVSEDGEAPWFAKAANTAAGVITQTSSDSTARIEVTRGPVDGLEYFCKYGIRFAGRDALFVGLGQRFIPWAGCGFIPFGQDCTPLATGGFRMLDRSATTVTAAYGAGIYTLTATHTNPDAYVVLNHQGFCVGNTNGGASPWGLPTGATTYTAWNGLGAVSGVANCNVNALRGYRLIAHNGLAVMAGGILRCLDYTEVGASYRMNVQGGAALDSWAANNFYVTPFRWHQRDLIHSDPRIFSDVRNYADSDPFMAARRQLSLRQAIVLDDPNEIDLDRLQACWAMDDAEGGTITEKVVGGVRNMFFAPLALATTPGGKRGNKLVFLSGEGEAPCFDLSANPVWEREIGLLLAERSKGFAIELSCVFTEACYAISQQVSVNTEAAGGVPFTVARARLVPDILNWESKQVQDSGFRRTPKTLLRLTHGGDAWDTNGKPFQRPMGFFTGVARYSDQEDNRPIFPSDLQPFFLDAGAANVSRFDLSAGWVGQSVTIQIGVQSTGVDDQYDVYVSMTPKDAFMSSAGDPSNGELAYWTDGSQAATGTGYAAPYQYTAAHMRLPRQDLARSVITIGKWSPTETTSGPNLGFCEMQPRMLVDELRVFARAAPGALPTVSGVVLSGRNGKIDSDDSLPARALSEADLLLPVGPGLFRVQPTDESRTLLAADNGSFFAATSATSIRAITDGLVLIQGERTPLPVAGAPPDHQDSLHVVRSVSANSATLEGRYYGATRTGAAAYHVPLAAYTDFTDDIRDLGLTLGPGDAYRIVTGSGILKSTTADAILSPPLWANRVPILGDCRVRLYTPLSRVSLRDILPSWTRGLTRQRANRITGGHGKGKIKYAASRGSIFEVDDRWRPDAPRVDRTYSLAFRSKPLVSSIYQGLEQDRAIFPSKELAEYSTSGGDANVTLYDAWVKIEAISGYQTILWIGDPQTDPSKNAGSTLCRFHGAMRLNRGRPELCFGSTARYDGVNVAEKGVYCVTSSIPIPVGQWAHVRFSLPTHTGGTTNLLIPWVQINGHNVRRSVSSFQNGLAANEWLDTATIVSSGSSGHVVVGAAFDSYLTPQSSPAFVSGNGGELLMPQRVCGWMHSLGGLLGEVTIVRVPVWAGASTGSPPPDFNPRTLSYAVPGAVLQFRVLHDALGFGHKFQDEASTDFATIQSHPFISLYHELGASDLPATFADFTAQTYVANGGRPARVQTNGSAGFAGVLPPTTAPTVSLQRFPIWRANKRTALADEQNEPVAQAATGVSPLVYHYDTHGNNWWTTAIVAGGAPAAEAVFLNDSTNGISYFGFKCLLRVRKITGRVNIVRRGTSRDQGGPFIELLNGAIHVGWFDKTLKQNVNVRTDAHAVKEGEVYYLNLRKSFPQQDVIWGNWRNSYFSNGAIRRVMITGAVNNFTNSYGVGDVIQDGADGAGRATARIIAVGPAPTSAAGTQVVEYIRLNTAGTAEFAAGTNIQTRSGVGGGGRFAAASIRPCNDILILRHLRTDTITGTNHETLEAKCDAATRNCVSFTVNGTFSEPSPPGNGLVSLPGLKGTGAVAGVFNADQAGLVAATSIDPFHADMVGMWLGIGNANQPRCYRIVSVNTSQQVTVIDDLTGTNPDLSGVLSKFFGVFIGTSLVKSTNFDASRDPDTGTYDINWFGMPQGASDTSDLVPFDGEWWTPGVTFCTTAVGTPLSNAKVFEAAAVDTSVDATGVARTLNDPIFTGTDTFAGPLGDAGVAPGELHYDSWAIGPPRSGTWFVPDAQTYAGAGGGASTQPNNAAGVLAITRRTANPACSANAPDAAWEFYQSVATQQGTRYFACVFFDEDQNQESEPGPTFALTPPVEDTNNPSGLARYLVSGLPFPRQSGRLRVWIAATAAGSQPNALFRVADVAAGTKDVGVVVLDTQIAQFPAILLARGAPPRCEIVETSRGRMLYGAAEVQPDGGFYSIEGFPGALDFSDDFAVSLFRVDAGDGEKITSLRELDGLVVATKRRTIASIDFLSSGEAIVQTLTTGVGCVGPQCSVALENRLYVLDTRGWVVLQRGSTASGLATPLPITDPLQDFFQDKIDRTLDFRFSCAINRPRSQVVLACKTKDDIRTTQRLSVEFAPAGTSAQIYSVTPAAHRFSRYFQPNVTTLATVQDLAGGADRLLAGTEEGFMVWLDRPETQRVLIGLEGQGFGLVSLQAIAGASSLAVPVLTFGGAPSLDTVLEGILGCPVQVQAPDGTIMRSTALGASGNTILLMDALPQLPLLASEVRIGAMEHRMELPWMDCGNARFRKELEYVNLSGAKGSDSTLTIDAYADLDVSEPVNTQLVGLADPNNPTRSATFGDVEGRLLKIVVRSTDLAMDTQFDLSEVLLQVRDVDPEGN